MGKEEILDEAGYIFSLIMSDVFDASVTSLALACKVSAGQMRKNLAFIADNSLIGELLYFEDEGDDCQDAFQEAILSGKYDDKNIVIERDNYNSDKIMLPVTSQEKALLKVKYPSFVEEEVAYDVKDIVPQVKKSVRMCYGIIKDALKSQQIEMYYKNKGGIYERRVCTPVSLIHDLSTNRIYFSDTQDNIYQLDRISNAGLKYKGPADMTGYKPNPNQPYTWGTIIDRESKPKHVKIKILNDISANTKSKIKRDLEWRQEKKLYELDGVTYYEDYVIDLDNFYSWLRKYGSSFEVMEPVELINMVVSEAGLCKAAYEMLDEEGRVEAILNEINC